ncbi:hypothetical protein ABL78_3491 [Leptomonas seymouri]|uniref:Uncharacterized protein n=1 Tax=Leptomonas seymouri TaxID=5684 RepID=A0A0N0P6P5_LEPSE|nr:hypothetical protein ABL78_3491 [Leptomonas seymouri]|eukprot:KPI87407.1 hypothetical protein ABL78_3491 [Leptomonas seymouri]
MSFLNLHPHFVSARNYDDVKAVVGLLKSPIDDDDFERPADAPFLPPTYSSTIHIQDGLSRLASTCNSASDKASREKKERADTLYESSAGAANAPLSNGTTCAAHAPLVPSLDHEPVPSQTNAPKSLAQPAGMNEFKRRHRVSSSRQSSRQPKILCVWDVDDTLVATGVSGIRQNLVFREQELVSLFRSAGPRTRHLLLSQGSIDDVFEKSSGQLRCIQKFVQRSVSSTASAHTSAAPLDKKEKEKSSFADMLRCSNGRQTKEQPRSFFGSHFGNGGGTARSAEKGIGGTNENDMRHFAPGTVVVRLSSVHDRPEASADSAFLTDPTKQPTCGRTSTVPLDEKAERMGRWLILRPEVWGITLASMNTIFPPSRNTAFVNGKVYRKMDVVWSLAMTGEWDSVFFIDNNLSEVGVVRYGMQMSDMLNLRSDSRVWRFFQSEFLLLTASAKLREMALRYGRDVTKPPPPSKEEGDSNNVNRAAKQKVGVNSVELNGKIGDKSTGAGGATACGDGAGESEELTPSKSTMTSSTDSALRGGSGQTSKLSPSGNHFELKTSVKVPVVAVEDIKIIDQVPSSSPPPVPRGAILGSSSHSDSLSLSSASPKRQSVAVPRFPITPTQSSKDVDLVVVNLHMSCEAYRRVLTNARTNHDGQRAQQREGSLLPRYVGQPVFIGDRSCTDEQYDAILKYFQETESRLFQLMDEDMRMNGYVDVHKSKRWLPWLHSVHAPVHKRPSFIPHMSLYFTPFFDGVEENVVKALQKYGGTSASCILHSEAQRQYFTLQRVLPFIDPYLTGDLGRALFDIYIVDGNISASFADYLRKTLNKVRERIPPKPDDT